MEKQSYSISINLVILSFLGTLLLYVIRHFHTGIAYSSVMDYVGIFALIVTLLLLPEEIAERKKNTYWYYRVDYTTIVLIIFLGVLGILQIFPMRILQFMLIIVGLYLIIKHFFIQNPWKQFKTIPFLVTAIVVGFMFVLVYSTQSITPFFEIQLFKNKAYLDTVFHMDISNMLSNYGVSSTGLDGYPYIPYHYGTHLLFGGLKFFCGGKILFFYHIAYPIIFIPLFYKAFIRFSDAVMRNFKSDFTFYASNFLWLLVCCGSAFVHYAHSNFVNHQSTFVSFILLFFVISALLKNRNVMQLSFLTFLLSSFFIISMMKVSTGLVFGPVLIVYLLYQKMTKRYILFTAILTIIALGVFGYLMFGINNAPLLKQNLSTRLRFLLGVLSDFYLTFWGIITVLFFFGLNHKKLNWSSTLAWIKSQDYLYLKGIIVSNIVGFVLMMYVISDGKNFLHYQFFMSLPLILVLFSKINFRLPISEKYIPLLFLVIVVFNVNDFSSTISSNLWYYRNAENLTTEQKNLKQFYLQNNRSNTTKEIIYVPRTEEWFYQNSLFWVIPAITGNPSVLGIPDKYLENQGWGYNYYPKHQKPTLQNAKNKAKKLGFKNLKEIHFQPKLTDKTYPL